MSSISFVDPSGEVRISGRERAMMASVCNDFRRAQTGDFKNDDLTWLAQVAKPGHYLHSYSVTLANATTDEARYKEGARLARALDTYLHVGDDDGALILDGRPVEIFSMMLNSALSWGNRAIALCAKLHGQCEIHAFCEGVDRAWLAELVQEALDCGVFRPDAWGYDGWPKLIEFLKRSDSEPVVTSYSVTDNFPNAGHAPEGALPRDDQGKIDWDAWYEISPTQQWEWGLAAIRQEPGLRISPDRLGAFFGEGMTGRAFMERVRAQTAQVLTGPPAAR